MDRRYREAAGAVRSGRAQSQALVRAKLARARIDARSARSRGNEDGPKSANPFGGIDVLRARAAQQGERNRIFQEEGSGVYGAEPAFSERWRRGEGPDGLLPGIG